MISTCDAYVLYRSLYLLTSYACYVAYINLTVIYCGYVNFLHGFDQSVVHLLTTCMFESGLNKLSC